MVIDSDLIALTEGERALIAADAARAGREKQHYAQMLRDHGYASLRQLYIDLVGSLGLGDPAGDGGLQKYAEEAQERLEEWSRVVLSVREAVTRLGADHQAIVLSTPAGRAIAPKSGETLGQMLVRYEEVRDRAVGDLQNAWSEAFKHIEALDIVENTLENILELPHINISASVVTTKDLPFDREDVITNSSNRISWWGRIGPWILNRDYELLTGGGKYTKQANRIVKIKSMILEEIRSSKSSISKSDLSNSTSSHVGKYLISEFKDINSLKRALEKFDSKTLHALKSKKSLKSLAVRKELVDWN